MAKATGEDWGEMFGQILEKIVDELTHGGKKCIVNAHAQGDTESVAGHSSTESARHVIR